MKNTIIDIIYEDNHILAINKRPGDLSQEDSSGDTPLQEKIMSFLKERDQKPGNVYLGTIHRLDRPVSGAIIYAKTSKAASRLSEMVRGRNMRKYYVAITCKGYVPDSDKRWIKLTDNLLRDNDITLVVNSQSEKTQNAVLAIRNILNTDSVSVQLIELITGRKHQIRAQLSHRKIPIIGDAKYHSSIKYEHGAIALHSFMLSFMHPVKKEPVDIIAPLPLNFAVITGSEVVADKCLEAIKESLHEE